MTPKVRAKLKEAEDRLTVFTQDLETRKGEPYTRRVVALASMMIAHYTYQRATALPPELGEMLQKQLRGAVAVLVQGLFEGQPDALPKAKVFIDDARAYFELCLVAAPKEFFREDTQDFPSSPYEA